MKQLLTDIQNRLMTINTLKYVDEDWGQMDYYMPHAPVKFPCALININNVQYSNAGDLLQFGLVNIVITVADIKLSNSSGKAPQLQKQAAWKVYDTIKAVVKVLHGWSGSAHYNPLSRTTITRRKNDDGINLFDINFTTNIKDVKVQRTHRFASAEPDVSIEKI